ncbi:putative toxin-antitoxin system toxin component, PIN family [Methylomonas methanica]|uniref:DNA-binding protein n=1 Tax=Methylomonas methanica TaxID=421 RepID=A0A177M3I9_METMH|nr:putative toxin-antitoxin system toxin component, PIN family [Methylomonas methanica]OAI00286.1 DNA-binding protein [Methylomonas methanica]
MVQVCIVLDTNVLLSGTAYPKSIPGEIISAWRSGSLEVKLSQYILDELQRVLPRLNHRLGWSNSEIREFVDSLAFLADLVDPLQVSEPLLRDRADQPVLGTFLAANANYLVTGDKDLLALSARYPIVTPAEFWLLHGG